MTRTASSSAEASGPQLASRIECAGCGAAADPLDPYPFRCPNADRSDDTDHVLVRRLGAPLARLDDGGGGETAPANPFVRFRGSFHSYHVALAAG